MIMIASPYPEISGAIAEAAVAAGMDADPSPQTVQGFASHLYRDPDSIGVLWVSGAASAVEIILRLRRADVLAPFLVLVDTGAVPGGVDIAESRATVLNAGADDCQAWPCDYRETAARLSALKRRNRGAFEKSISELVPGVWFKRLDGVLRSDGAAVALTNLERKVLIVLVDRGGAVVRKGSIMDAIYGIDADRPASKVIDVIVSRLRAKIAAVAGGNIIETVYGEGYKLTSHIGEMPGAKRRRAS